ncbi:peptidase M50B protein [Trifolium repens]|nr:peptidase M50B protein [Trifolium repens]
MQWTLRGLCIGFIIFLGVIWILQETTEVRILRYIILFIGVMNSLFSVYDIYDDLISRRVHSSDAEKFAEVCPCPCTGVGWGVIWGLISFAFLCGAVYLGAVILS